LTNLKLSFYDVEMNRNRREIGSATEAQTLYIMTVIVNIMNARHYRLPDHIKIFDLSGAQVASNAALIWVAALGALKNSLWP